MSNESDQRSSIAKALDEKIPRSMVSERDGGGGRRLSYLEGWYVIDRLNQVFGHLGWSNEVVEIKEVVNKTSKGEYPAYLVKVRLMVHTSAGNIVKEGYGYGSDKSSQNAHELAIKEAVTDAIKVAAKNLGMSLGLALYDKTQENVNDEETTVTSNDQRASNQQPVTAPISHSGDGSAGPSTSETNTNKIQEAIKSCVRVGVKLGKITVEGFKKELTEKYKVGSLSELSILELKSVLKNVQELTGGANVH